MVDVFLLVNCTGEHEKQVTSDLQEISVEVCNTFGIFDFVCKIQGKDIASTEEMIQNIRKIQHVTSTNTIQTIPEQE